MRLQEFSLTKLQIGFFFAIMPVFYMTTGFLIQFLPTYIDNRFVLMVGTLGVAIGTFCIGPSQILFLPK